MTVNSTSSRIALNGNGASTTFTIPFYFLQNSDLLVYVDGIAQKLDIDYAITGTGEAAGGELNFINPPAAGIRNVVIIRDPDLLQGTKYPPNDPFPAKTHETALDKLTMLAQRTRDLIDRTFVLTDADSSSVSLTVPAPQAGYLIGWNETGKGLANFAGTGGAGTLPLPVSLANGGTGAANAAAARSNLGLASGATTTVGSAALLNAGTAAGNLVQLDASARLPAIDASQLTNIIKVPVRQTVLAGALDANGYAAWLAAGSGLAVNTLASATPVTLAFARGYNAYGADDVVTRLAADQTNPFGNLPANNTAFLYADYVSPTAISAGTTLVPPQYGYAFDKTRAALFHFNGTAGATTFLDDWGQASVAVNGAKLQNTQVPLGWSTSLGGAGTNSALNGTADYVQGGQINLGATWTIRARFYVASFNTYTPVFALQPAIGTANFCWEIYAGKMNFNYNPGSSLPGTITVTTGSWHFLEVTYDGTTLRSFLNGVQDNAVATTSVNTTGTLFLGAAAIPGQGTYYLPGYIGEFEILPYCTRRVSTSYTPPSSPSSVAMSGASVSWFDIPNMKMWEVTGPSTTVGTNPALTARNRLFVGECDTAAASVAALRNYAYQGRFRSTALAPPVGGSAVSASHNLGVDPKIVSAYLVNKIPEATFIPGEIVSNFATGISGSTNYAVPSFRRGRNTVSMGSYLSNMVVIGGISGSQVAITNNNWDFYFDVQRGW